MSNLTVLQDIWGFLTQNTPGCLRDAQGKACAESRGECRY